MATKRGGQGELNQVSFKLRLNCAGTNYIEEGKETFSRVISVVQKVLHTFRARGKLQLKLNGEEKGGIKSAIICK